MTTTPPSPAISPAHLRAYPAACERALVAKVAYHATPIGGARAKAALEELTIARQIVDALEDGFALGRTDPAGWLVARADDNDRMADASPPQDEREARMVREMTAAKRVAARLLRAAEDATNPERRATVGQTADDRLLVGEVWRGNVSRSDHEKIVAAVCEDGQRNLYALAALSGRWAAPARGLAEAIFETWRDESIYPAALPLAGPLAESAP